MSSISFNNNKDKYIDYLHISLGIVIIIMACLALIKPEENLVLFPFIFLLSGVLYFLLFAIEALFTKNKISMRMKLLQLSYLVFAIFLFFMFFVSRVIIWEQ